MKKKKTKKVSERTLKRRRNAEDKASLKVVSTIIAISIALFVALSNFSLCGSIGEVIRNIILSTFGTFGYLFPLILVVAIIFNLYNDRKSANIKIYSILILYVTFICFVETFIHDFTIEPDIQEALNGAAIRARNGISFDQSKFSGGFVGTGISYLTNKMIGKTGSITVFATISIISFLLLFGLGISKIILKFLAGTVLFIPNLIKKINQRKEEDLETARENEEILKRTIENSKKVNLGVKYEYIENEPAKLILEPIEERKTKKFDTSNLDITAEDVQSRFFKADEKDIAEKNQLLREMKKKSINEIMCEKKDLKSDEFFYMQGMKPVDEMENIQIPAPNIPNINMPDISIPEETIPEVSISNDFRQEEKYHDDDNKTFASGLDNLREKSDVLDIKTKTSKEILENTTKDIEIKNTSIKNSDLLTTDAVRRKKHKKYKFPPLNFLLRSEKKASEKDPLLTEKANTLVETLKQFGVGATVTNITVGPTITRFELKPDIGVKVAKILSLEDDLKLALEAVGMRIEAPIPGKPAIGIEIPNKAASGVLLGDLIASPEFRNSESKLTIAVGKDISGKVITADLRKMPHVLVAGSTGSGKSVFINSVITSLIYKSSPEDVRLIMVDPKVVELQIYDGIPHLLIPVVTSPKKAAAALNWAVSEMTRRYNLIQEKRVRDIESYNKVIEGEINKISVNDNNEAEFETPQKLPYIVIIIDEFADLMMTAPKDVESAVERIAQLARACGIYLVIATQRPSVNVISGSIKINVPSRISFAISSGVDSQTILDRRGAEKLIGHGDMLYFPQWLPEPLRVQGCFVSDKEILDIVSFIKDDTTEYDIDAEKAIESGSSHDASAGSYDPNEKDDLYVEAGKLIIEQQNASIGMLQRRFRIGFNRAARIIDQLEANGVVSKQDGKKAREVLVTLSEFEEMN